MIDDIRTIFCDNFLSNFFSYSCCIFTLFIIFFPIRRDKENNFIFPLYYFCPIRRDKESLRELNSIGRDKCIIYVGAEVRTPDTSLLHVK